MSYYDKYKKYKSKYIYLEMFGGSKLNNVIFDKYNKNDHVILDEKYNFERSQWRISNTDMLNLEILNIPDNYPKESILIKAQQEIVKDKLFFNNVNRFASKNCTIMDINLDKGFVNVTTNDNIKYQLNVTPFLTLNMDTNILCWSWINSIFLNKPDVDEKIQTLFNKVRSNIIDVPHLKWDCISNFDQNKKADIIFYDVLALTRYLLVGLGYIGMIFPPKINKNYISNEYWMITNIKNLKN